MPEEVLFEFEADQSRQETATYLRTVADKLDSDAPITLEAGNDAVTLDPPTNVEFEVKAEREGSPNEAGELSIEFELEWAEGSDESGSLAID